MDFLEVEKMLLEHKEFFRKGDTLNVNFRIEALKKLKEAIKENESELLIALKSDLGKCEFEAFATEIGFIFNSISYTISQIRKWAKDKKVRMPIYQFPSTGKIVSEPYGTVLIIGPFNYPFQLLIEPLIGAISAGNCAVLKPSENTPNVSKVVDKIISKAFSPDYVRVVHGEKDVTNTLINSKFDYIFFTGSVGVGKIVMSAASKNLIPITLELGGKSPVIVDKTANIEICAKRVVWGKLLNNGQTCIAPDYVLVNNEVKDNFVESVIIEIEKFYGKEAKKSDDYGRIVNDTHFNRLNNIIKKDEKYIRYGGKTEQESLYIQPTVLLDVDWETASMEDEIFGPILPIMGYDNLDEIIDLINSKPKPLALYLFTNDKMIEKRVVNEISFGGGCINDTISHVTSEKLPFGGVGNAGIGSYHGKYSFDTFSHKKSILKKSTRIKSDIVFPPYKNKIALVRRIFK